MNDRAQTWVLEAVVVGIRVGDGVYDLVLEAGLQADKFLTARREEVLREGIALRLRAVGSIES